MPNSSKSKTTDSHVKYMRYGVKAGLALVTTITVYALVRAGNSLPSWLQWSGEVETGLASSERETPSVLSVIKQEQYKTTEKRRSMQNSDVIVINPLPDQIIATMMEYIYNLDGREIFSGEFDWITVQIPSWITSRSNDPVTLSNVNKPSAATDAAVTGSLALVVGGSELQVIDISNSSDPVEISNLAIEASRIVLSGSLALLGRDSSGVQVIDFSNPSNPLMLGSTATLGTVRDVAVSGSLLLVAVHTSGLQVIDFSNPNSLVLVSSMDTSGRAEAIAVSGTLALLAEEGPSSGLQIINISNSSNPVIVGGVVGGAGGVAVSGTLAFVSRSGSLRIIDFSDPSAPIIVDEVGKSSSAANNIVLKSSLLLSNVDIIDISNPSNSFIIGKIPSVCFAVAVNGSIALLPNGDDGLSLIDFAPKTFTLQSYPPAYTLGQQFNLSVTAWRDGIAVAVDVSVITVNYIPQSIDTNLQVQSQLSGTTQTLSLDSDRLFEDADNELLRLDVSESSTEVIRPAWLNLNLKRTLASLRMPDWALDVAVSDSLALVAARFSGLQIVDISDPSNPLIVGSLEIPESANNVAVSGSLALVLSEYTGLYLIEFNDPQNPVIVGSLIDQSYAFTFCSVATSGSMAFVLQGEGSFSFDNNRLLIVNISNSSNPVISSSVELGYGYQSCSELDIVLDGSLALIVESPSLQLIDVSDLNNPNILGSVSTNADATGVAVQGTLAFVSGKKYLVVIDISNPNNPVIVGKMDTVSSRTTYGVAVSGSLVFVGSHSSGLEVIDFNDPANPVIISIVNTPGWPFDVTITGGIALVPEGRIPGLRVIDLTQWELIGTPGPEDVGNYELLLTATDSLGGSASDTFTWRVEGPPIIQGQLEDRQHRVGQPFVWFVPPDLVMDPNADLIVFNAQQLGGDPLPDWLTFNPVSATLFGIPASEDTGQLIIELLATDNIVGAASTNFSLLVDHEPIVNRALNDQIAGVGIPFQFVLASDTFLDRDNDPLQVNARRSTGEALPTWLQFNVSTLTFFGTPNASQVGSLVLEVAARDAYPGEAVATFALTVEYFPVVQQAVNTSVAAIGEPAVLAIPMDSFYDADDTMLSLSAQQASGDRLPSWLSFNPVTRTFTGIPDATSAGLLALQVIATDRYGASAVNALTWRISHRPQAQYPLTDQVVAIGSDYHYSLPDDMFADADETNLTMSIQVDGASTLPAWLQFNATALTLSGQAQVNSSRSYGISVIATDRYGLSGHATFKLHLNHFPQFVGTLQPPIVGVGVAWRWPMPAGAFTDADDEPLTYELTRADGGPAPSWLSITSQSGVLAGTPSALDLGDTTLLVVASDAVGATTQGSLTLTVVYAPQVAKPLQDILSAREGLRFTLTLAPDTFEDLDDNVLNYRAIHEPDQPLPNWLHFTANNLTVSGTPDAFAIGEYRLAIIANDPGGAEARLAFTVQVDANVAPEVATPITDQRVTVLNQYSFFIPSTTFFDANADTLSYQIGGVAGDGLPAWLQFDAAQRRLYGTPQRTDVNHFGLTEHAIRVTARDDRESASTDFTLSVQGESHLRLFIRIGSPLITLFTALLAAYKQRALVINRYQPERYIKAAETATIGERYQRMIKLPADQNWVVYAKYRSQVKPIFTPRFFQCRKHSIYQPVPGSQALPRWLLLDADQQQLRSRGPVPDLANEALTIFVEDAAGIVKEQFDLTVRSPSLTSEDTSTMTARMKF